MSYAAPLSEIVQQFIFYLNKDMSLKTLGIGCLTKFIII